MIAALGLERCAMVSLIGAGGKTSLMFALAREGAGNAERVLVTTTTKIAREEANGRWPCIFASNAAELLERAAMLRPGDRPGHGSIVIAVRAATPEGDRLAGLDAQSIDEVMRSASFDRVLVEADGSARRPLKAPSDHEPVIPSASSAVVVVAGLHGIGLPLGEDTVFRSALWAERCGLSAGAPVSAESLAAMIGHPQGLAKGCPAGSRRVLFLNRADTPARVAAARRIVELLADMRPAPLDCVAYGRLLPHCELVGLENLSPRR